jgi:ribose transport system permease protein
MTESTLSSAPPEADVAPSDASPDPTLVTTPRSRLRRALSFRNSSALYVFAVIFVVFSLWIPDLFLRKDTFQTLLDEQAVTALLAIGLVVPLAAGAFDLSIGATLGFGMVFAAWLLSKGVAIAPAILLAVAAGAAIGLINGLLVVRSRIDSFIATLGMSSILLALVAWISGGEQILGLSTRFQDLTLAQPLGVTVPVYLMLAVGLVVWYLLERTPAGRRVYATGGSIEAARLTGVRTSTVIVLALCTCSLIAALCGVIVASRVGAGDPTTGPGYLLPAFSAAFLGSTQFRGGRFNVWGTIVAVYVLATGVKGLQLAGAPVWIPDLFNGVALLVAVGLAKYQRAPGQLSAIRRMLGGRLGPPQQALKETA